MDQHHDQIETNIPELGGMVLASLKEIIQFDTGKVVDTYYEALITMDRIDDSHWVEISEKVYNDYLAELEAEKEHHDGLWYVKAGRWCSNAAADVADWVTFWD